MLTIYLGLDGGSETFLETSDQYFLVISRDKVKLLEHDLKMFQVYGLVHDVFLLVLSVLFDLTPETIHKGSRIAKGLA